MKFHAHPGTGHAPGHQPSQAPVPQDQPSKAHLDNGVGRLWPGPSLCEARGHQNLMGFGGVSDFTPGKEQDGLAGVVAVVS